MAAFTNGGPAKKIVPVPANDDGLVAHRWHIRTSGRARTHNGCDLGNALGRQLGLVVEDAAEVIPIGEDLGLQRQKRAAGVNQVHTGQTIFGRNLLGSANAS